jgi:hypothetical protein
VPPSTLVCKDCFPLYHRCHTLGLDLPHRLFPCDIRHCLRCTLFVIRADLLYSLLTSGLPHHVHVAHYGRPTVTITHPLSLPPAPVPAHPSLTLTLSATLVLAHPHPHPPSLSPAIGHPLQRALPPSPSLVPSLVHPLPWALPHPPSHPVSPPPFLHTLSLSLSLPVHPLPHALAHSPNLMPCLPLPLPCAPSPVHLCTLPLPLLPLGALSCVTLR